MSNNVNSKLTAEQIRFAEVLADPTDQRTQAEIALELNVRPETLSRWKRTRGFSELVFALSIVEVKARMSKVMAGLYRAAEDGDVPASRLLFELVGIHQLQAAQRLFNEDVYIEHLENIGDGINASPLEQIVMALREACDPYSEQLIWLME